MKNNKLSKVYTSLYNLNEELVNIERFSLNGNSREVWDVEFDNDKITTSSKKTIDKEFVNVESGSTSLANICQISKKYSSISPAEILFFYNSTIRIKNDFRFRITPLGWKPELYIEYLNKYFRPLCLGDNKSKTGKGLGELACHLAFKTTNWNNAEEPDVIIDTGNKGSPLRVSVKSFKTSTSTNVIARGSVRTGESIDSNIKFVPFITNIKNYLGLSSSDDIDPNNVHAILKRISDASVRNSKIDSLKNEIMSLKQAIVGEHQTSYIFIWTGYEFTLLTSKQRTSGNFSLDDTLEDIGITKIKGSNNRVTFAFNPAFSNNFPDRFPNAYVSEEDLRDALNKDPEFSNLKDDIKNKLANNFSKFKFTKSNVTDFYKKNKSDLLTVSTSQNEFSKKFLDVYNSINKEAFVPYTGRGYRTLMDAINAAQNLAQQQSITSSYIPKGKTLKEVYSNLYNRSLKKKR